MAAVYGVNPQNDVEISIGADYPTQAVYILITAENATGMCVVKHAEICIGFTIE